MRKKLFYLHIPKTAGQTLALRLSSVFPVGRSSILGPTLVHPAGAAELRELLQQNDFVEKHITGPVLAEFPDLEIITTIREPVSQIVSNYLHILRDRHNWLHRAVSILSPYSFFEIYGDLLANAQAKYLVQAFFEKTPETCSVSGLCHSMLSVMDKLEYIVPADCLDEFAILWTVETGFNLDAQRLSVNRAIKDESYGSLLEIVKGMPHLYSLDLLLWHSAKERFLNYKRRILGGIASQPGQWDVSCSYFNEGAGIWLQEGWYPPQRDTQGELAWWAGPQNYSKVFFSRSEGIRFIEFDVIVWCGTAFDKLRAVGPDRHSVLPMCKVESDLGSSRLSISLDGLPLVGEIYLWVPHVLSPVITSADSADHDRKSFATQNWRLVS